MPELPEVETIKRQLTEWLPLTIHGVSLSDVASSIVHTPLNDLVGITIHSISRHGKMMIFNLSDERKILSHLGMSGSWRVSKDLVVEKHTHIQFECSCANDEKAYLAYVDPRRFGHLYMVDENGFHEKLKTMGVDVSTENLTTAYMKKMFERFPKRSLKDLFLDQRFFAGIGNYMASEICAHAKVLPMRECKTLSKEEIDSIRNAIRIVLDQSIESQGTTFQGGYTDAFGERGEGVQNLVVFYQEICQLCKKTKVVKIQHKGRGTYYCPHCQK